MSDLTKVFPACWCLRGRGVLWTQHQRTAFRMECSNENCTVHRVRQIMGLSAKTSWKKSVPFPHGVHFTDFPFAWLRNTTKIEKNKIKQTNKKNKKCHFSNSEFQWNLAQSSRSSIEKHITETKVWFFVYSLGILRAKKIFYRMPKYANLC